MILISIVTCVSADDDDIDMSILTCASSMLFVVLQIPEFNGTCISIFAGENCGRLVGYRAVYRLSAGLVAFFFIMMLLTPCVPSSNHWRASVQNGYCLRLAGFLCVSLFLMVMLTPCRARASLPTDSGYCAWLALFVFVSYGDADPL